MLPINLVQSIPANIVTILPDDGQVGSSWPVGDNGLVVWYSPTNTTDWTINDLSDKGTDGTMVNVSLAISGDISAFDFGNWTGDQGIICPLALSGHDYSFEFWVNWYSTGAPQVFLNSAELMLYLDEFGYMYTGALSGNGVGENVWTHLIWSFDSSSLTCTMYIDGVGGSVNLDSEPLAVTSPSVIGNLMGFDTEPTAAYLNGQIGLFRAYSKALSQAEVSSLFDKDRSRYGV